MLVFLTRLSVDGWIIVELNEGGSWIHSFLCFNWEQKKNRLKWPWLFLCTEYNKQGTWRDKKLRLLNLRISHNIGSFSPLKSSELNWMMGGIAVRQVKKPVGQVGLPTYINCKLAFNSNPFIKIIEQLMWSWPIFVD